MNCRKLIVLIFMSLLFGCTSKHVFDFNARTAGYYKNSEFGNEERNHSLKVWFGPYQVWGFGGRYREGLKQYFDKGNLTGEEINAWWMVRYKDKPNKYFYARSLPNQGIQADPQYLWSDWVYFAYISFGPMYIDEDALTEKQRNEHLRLMDVSEWSGLHFYAWGKENSFYYVVNKDRVDPQVTPRNWIEVPGIAITKAQYELLDQRCGKPWFKKRCFMDESFPDLTDQQIQYIRSHEHEDDEYWLSDEAEPPDV